MTTSTIPCANPRCTNHLTYHQLMKGGRYCCNHCAKRKPKHGNTETYAETAARLGVTRQTLRNARKAGRYRDGVYTPAKIGRPEK